MAIYVEDASMMFAMFLKFEGEGVEGRGKSCGHRPSIMMKHAYGWPTQVERVTRRQFTILYFFQITSPIPQRETATVAESVSQFAM